MKWIFGNIRRLGYAWSGIWYALRFDKSYRIQVAGGGVVVALCVYFFWPLSEMEMFFLGLAWILILITELQNSAFEAALDRLHPEMHDEIGRSKDMAAGAVMTAGFFLIFVIFLLAYF